MTFDIPSDSEEEVPDWLKNLQSGGETVDPNARDMFSGQAEEDVPDWLPDNEVDGMSSKDQPAEDVPDWLEGLQSGRESVDPDPGNMFIRQPGEGRPIVDESSGGQPAEDMPDWLEGLQPDGESIDPDLGDMVSSEPGEGTPAGDPDETLKDEIAEEPSEEDVPDWLEGLQPGGESVEPDLEDMVSSEPSEGTPAGDPDETLRDEIAEEPSEEDVPDWLTSIRASESALGPQIQEASADIQDDDAGQEWLKNIRDQEAQESIETTPPDDDASGDVLQRIQTLKAEEEGTSEEEEGEVQDWLSGLGGEAPVGEEPSIQVPESQVEGGSDWLGDLVGEEFDADANVPEWLSDVVEEELPTPPVFSEEMPAWEEGLSDAADAVDSEFPDLPGEPGGDDAPSWLANLQESAPDLETPDDEIVIEEAVIAPALSEEEEKFILEPTDLPDWLNEAAPDEVVVEDVPPAQEVTRDVDIAPADLPNWLQAMRPVEAVAPVETPEKTAPGVEESIGPLAGLSDVLPAEPDIVHFGSPSTPVTGFNITKAQQEYSQLLHAMVVSEEDVSKTTRRKVALPQQILRWVIAAFLYAVVIIPIFGESSAVSLPDTSDTIIEIQDVAVKIDDLQEKDAILIAFEYQPGLSGEMEAAAAAVVDHLLTQGISPVLISTQPTGPGLAEKFLQNTQNQHLIITDNQYINLGYISGGSAALLNLASDPRAAVPLLLEDGSSIWDQGALRNIHTIHDFAMVLVITDDADTARGWIEQVQPQLVDPLSPTPMTMVVSAQAEPLVYPYYLTFPKQVDGLVSGIAGGAYYENLTNRPGPAGTYWDAFSAGLTIAILIIIFGGLVNGFRSFMASRSDPRQKG